MLPATSRLSRSFPGAGKEAPVSITRPETPSGTCARLGGSTRGPRKLFPTRGTGHCGQRSRRRTLFDSGRVRTRHERGEHNSNCTGSYPPTTISTPALMKRSRRTHASRFRTSLLLLALGLIVYATGVEAQTEDGAATVMPAEIADSSTDAPAATDTTPATVIPAGESSDGSSTTYTPTQTPATVTDAPSTTTPAPTDASWTTAPAATEAPLTTAPAATEAPASTTESPTVPPTITGAAAETAAPATETPTTAPVATQAPAATTVPPVATATPVTDASAATTSPASTTSAPAASSAAPTAAPSATEAPVPEAPTAAPVTTQAPTAATTEAPTTAPVTTAPPATTAPAETTPTPTASTQTPAETTTSSPSPDASSSSASSTTSEMGSSNSATSSTSSSSKASSVTPSTADSGADTSTSDSVGNSGGLTLSPINSDDGDTDADTTNSSSGSNPTNASTSSGQSKSFGGWKLALVIVGALCAVMASIFFVHMRHVRAAAANKRSRGSSQQRALDSFFRQNRVTVARETGVSSGNFVIDPLTPRDDIAVTIPSNHPQDRPRTNTADLIAGSAAQAFNRRMRPGSGAGSSASIETPTDSYHGDEYDSFTGRQHAPSTASTNSSNFYRSDSVYSDTSSLGSIAPSATSSQRSLQTPMFATRLETVASSQGRSSKRASSATSIGDLRDTNRSDRSSSDFSVFNSSSMASSDADIYRISTQLIDVSALPETSELHDSYPSSGRMSDALSEFSVDESYSNESFATVDSYATEGDDLDVRDSNSDSVVFRTSKDSELSEGEI